MDPALIRDQAVSGIAWTSMQKAGARVATLVTFVVLARTLSPRDFGIVALAAVFVGVVSALADAGFASYLVQARVVDQKVISTAFWSVLGFSTLLSGALALSAPLWAAALQSPDLTPVLQWLSLGVLLTGLSSTQVALLKRRLAFKVLALRSLASVLVSCVVAVTLALSGAGVWSLVAQSLTLSVTSVAILWTAARWRPSLTFSRPIAVEIGRYGSKVATSQIVMSLRARGDDLLIAAILGATALGYWTIATRVLGILLDTGISVVSTVATPVFARLKDDPPRLRRAYMRAVSSSLAILTPILVSVAIVSPVLIPLVFGDSWARSGELAQIVTLTGVAVALTYFDRGLMLALDRPGTELAATVGLTILGLLVVAAVAPFGLTAVAFAVVGRAVVAWPIRLTITTRSLGLDVRMFVWRVCRLIVSGGVGAIAGVSTYVLLESEADRAIVVVVVPTVTTVMTAAVLRWLLPDVWSEMRSVLHRRRRVGTVATGLSSEQVPALSLGGRSDRQV